MTTITEEKDAPPAAPKFTLAAPRKRVKTGIPTNGLGILCGLPKGGKTTLAASIPGCVVLELEGGGADRIDGWVQEVADLATLRSALQAAVEDPSVKAIALDSIDVFNDWSEAEIAAEFGLESISERREGVNGFEVWKLLRQRYEGLVSYLKKSQKLAILIAHSKEPKLDAEGRLVVPMGISIPGKLGGYLAAEADFIGNVYKKQVGSATVHYLSFQGGPLGTWGSRIPELEDKIIPLPRTQQWAAVEEIFTVPKKVEDPKKDEKKAAFKNGKKGE